MAASTVSRDGAVPSAAGVSSPSRSSVVDDAPKQTVARYALRSPRWYSATRVACPRKTGRTPDANGSSVPPWPTRFVAARRRTRATMSCDVGPAGFATTTIPSRPGPSEERAISACERFDEPGRLGDHARLRLRKRGVDRGAGRSGMPATAECSGEDGRVHATGFRADADAGG